MSSVRFGVAETEEEIRRCFPVMRELRPHFADENKFVAQVQRQQRDGYFIAFVESDGAVRAVAGCRYLESLFSGNFMYVDDLVTREADRSLGFGGQLLDWLIDRARQNGCDQFELDSGVQRFDAHRFYFSKRMKIAAYHFTLPTKS